ncbi:MAG TPA: flagellar motor switch protein FliN [Candidatus Handelsmanbacteria bacterium]|nr:flagellar motor switch protein FliN [Candidatus Handelsmanbacteria bacterium]HIK98223.1 flagellar motor switch protein FliN [Dehalococcoidia bacterium]
MADEKEKVSTGSRLPDVPVTVSMGLGRTMKTLNEVLSIGEQSLIELDKRVGDPIDVYLNGTLFARGEVVTVNENFGVRVTELLNPE